MNIEKIDNEIEENYLFLMKAEESKNKNYILKAGFFSLIFIGLYFMYDNNIFLYIGLFVILSILAGIYKLYGFKDGYKCGYLAGKDIDIRDYEHEKLIQD